MPTTKDNSKHLPSGPLVDLLTHPMAIRVRRLCESMRIAYESIWPNYDEDRWYLTDYAIGKLVHNDCAVCIKTSIHKKRRQIRALERAGGLYDGACLFVIEKDGVFRLSNGHNTVAMLWLLGLPAMAVWINAPENHSSPRGRVGSAPSARHESEGVLA